MNFNRYHFDHTAWNKAHKAYLELKLGLRDELSMFLKVILQLEETGVKATILWVLS